MATARIRPGPRHDLFTAITCAADRFTSVRGWVSSRSDLSGEEATDRAAQIGPEPVTEHRQSRERSGHHDRIDALAALLRPVAILQVEPEREFVERQRRA